MNRPVPIATQCGAILVDSLGLGILDDLLGSPIGHHCIAEEQCRCSKLEQFQFRWFLAVIAVL